MQSCTGESCVLAIVASNTDGAIKDEDCKHVNSDLELLWNSGLRTVEYYEKLINVLNPHQQWTVNLYPLIVNNCSAVVALVKIKHLGGNPRKQTGSSQFCSHFLCKLCCCNPSVLCDQFISTLQQSRSDCCCWSAKVIRVTELRLAFLRTCNSWSLTTNSVFINRNVSVYIFNRLWMFVTDSFSAARN
jgi:hypothetical protein